MDINLIPRPPIQSFLKTINQKFKLLLMNKRKDDGISRADGGQMTIKGQDSLRLTKGQKDGREDDKSSSC